MGERRAAAGMLLAAVGLLQVATVSLVGAEPVHAAVCVRSALYSPAATRARTVRSTTAASVDCRVRRIGRR